MKTKTKEFSVLIERDAKDILLHQFLPYEGATLKPSRLTI
jgi:hypothetical protein